MARILLVDEDQDYLDHMTFVLGWWGHEASEERSAQHAVTRFRNEGFDLVITGMFMPDMDGLDLIADVRHISPDAKIIVLASNGRHSIHAYIQSAAKAMGAAAVIHKWALYSELNRVIAEVLE